MRRALGIGLGILLVALGCSSASSTPDVATDPAGDASAVDSSNVPEAGRATSPDAATDRGDAGASRASGGCGKTGAKTGDVHLSAQDGRGTARDYEVVVPSSYDASIPLALTIAYHGAGGDEAAARAFGLENAPGANASAIFVYPQGVAFQTFGVGWDDSCGGYDMPLFDAMLAAIEADYCIDRERVFVAGFSWGGDQVTALACCRGDRIRAIGAASCTDEYSDTANYKTYSDLPCPVANHAAIRFTHATTSDNAYPAPEFATTSELYRSFNGCSGTSTAVTPSPCEQYAGCTNPLIECAYPALGHTIPPNWGNDTWAFFSSFH